MQLGWNPEESQSDNHEVLSSTTTFQWNFKDILNLQILPKSHISSILKYF